jgi:hypothetical protein
MHTRYIAASADPDPDFWFDSILDNSVTGPQTNAELTLALTLKMNAVDPGTVPPAVLRFLPFLRGMTFNYATDDEDKATHWMKIRKWNPPEDPFEFKTYMRRFQQGAQHFWDRRFWLIPPATFTDFDFKAGGARYRPNVYCRFRMWVQDTGGFYNVEADAYRLDLPPSVTQSPFRSYAAGPGLTGKFSNLDVVQQVYPLIKDDQGRPHTYHQFTNDHETGHMLGMDHAAKLFPALNWAEFKALLGVLTSKDGFNSRNGYGEGYRPEVGGNIMGDGHARSPVNALPWQHRMAVHTHTRVDQWVATDRHVLPRKL